MGESGSGDAESLYADAELYDRLVAALGERGEADFYAKLAPHPQTTILELGSGTGRLSLPLAAIGHAVTGIDKAAAMMAVAQRKATLLQSTARFVLADLRSFSLGRSFELVMLPNNTLGHLHSWPDLKAFFACVRAHLAHDGLFVVDMFNPAPGMLALGPGHRFPVVTFSTAAGEEVVVTETSSYDAATQICQLCWVLRYAAGHESRLLFKLRVFFPQELQTLLNLSGFAIQATYGGFDGAPFGSQSAQQLLVCRKLKD